MIPIFVDCEQSLGLLPEKKEESLSFFVPLPSRAFNNPRGHMRVSRVLLTKETHH